MSEIYYSYFHSPVGKLLVAAENDALIYVNFDKGDIISYPQWIYNDELTIFDEVFQALTRYFNGEKETFSNIKVDFRGTEFQRTVWGALRQIPYGKTASYGELASIINNPKAVRAVGGAVGRNPISIIVPCHRILSKNRELTGFGGGLPIKRYLLQLEQIDYQDKGVEQVSRKCLKLDRTF